MKTCNYCHIEKSLEAFAQEYPGKLQRRCKECQNILTREHYQKNKHKYKQHCKNARDRAKKYIDTYKSNKGCVVCKETFAEALDLHHVNPEDKYKALSRMKAAGTCAKNLDKEIIKCIVLCASCHRKFHAGYIELPVSTIPGEGIAPSRPITDKAF